ncbi:MULTISPECIES: class I SAM-dependent methyltransferase [Rhodococcus]|uniref:class I SAM-dependent methyltransferase n=1 Tax=Rhodococcus TaxID=1827 RepID=UPI002954EB3D|nr:MULTISPECIES: methyltransferase domain-containing protein [Rhodococcus]MDV7246572.1 methyltransferase domain-containing protein [Rhodococcus oxybenzonivorans]MDV7337584.1 methyltransferase domain-containing protein [Rhodococcus oxybenzonivorans]MDV8031406.1 methyltransferase domain-containing protein [Rhodococcus sp. IEGM 27]
MRQPGNAKVEKVFDTMSRHYDTQMGFFERFVLGPARQWAVAQASGRVLEIAVGTGLNLPLYGPQVEKVVGVDLSEGMLDVARRRIAQDRLERVEVRRGDVQELDVPDASVDTVVSTFTFCTIPDPLQASKEALRVLVPGGRIVLAEHGPATNTIGLALMRAVEPLSVRFGTDHLTRDPAPYLEEAGFTIDTVHRSGRGGVGFRIIAHKPA